MKTALVTGASGFIGLQLCHYLRERSYRVRALTRSSSAMPFLLKSAEIVQGDVTDRNVLNKAVADVDVVFHLAAQLHIDRPSPALQNECFRINVEGTRCLLEAAQAARVSRFIFFSSINVYGSSRTNDVYTEDSPCNPDSPYAETKVQGEQLALAQAPAVVLRLAAVYGPGMKGNYVSLVNALQKKRFVMIGDGKNRRTLVHCQDVCKAAVLAAEKPCALGQTYNVTDGQVHSLRQIIDAISMALKCPSPRLHLPVRLVRGAAGLVESGMSMINCKSPISRAMVDKLVQDIAVSGAKIRRDLGFEADYPLERGWSETALRRAA